MRRIPLRARDGSVRAYALVDDADFERFGGLRWCAHGNGYVSRRGPSGTVYLHREILGLRCGDGREGDHANRDPLDCRRENLRVTDRAGNVQNVGARGGSSRFRGVSWAAWAARWQAKLTVAGRQVKLGYHEDEVQAALMAERGRRRHLPMALPDPELVKLGLA